MIKNKCRNWKRDIFKERLYKIRISNKNISKKKLVKD